MLSCHMASYVNFGAEIDRIIIRFWNIFYSVICKEVVLS